MHNFGLHWSIIDGFDCTSQAAISYLYLLFVVMATVYQVGLRATKPVAMAYRHTTVDYIIFTGLNIHGFVISDISRGT